MTSLATVFAYQDDRVSALVQSSDAYDKEALRRLIACAIAYHGCRPGSFAQAYAWADLMNCFGIDVWSLPMSQALRHPLRSAILAWRFRTRKP